jgi:hypothetical protein
MIKTVEDDLMRYGKMVLMKWDVWRSGVPRIDDTETLAPDGEYTFRVDMKDYTADHDVVLGWESQLPVTVKDGNINKIQALKAAGHLISMTGYPGRRLRTVSWDTDTKHFYIGVTA